MNLTSPPLDKESKATTNRVNKSFISHEIKLFNAHRETADVQSLIKVVGGDGSLYNRLYALYNGYVIFILCFMLSVRQLFLWGKVYTA